MTTKQALLNAIEQLPEQQLIEVLQYVQRLSHAQESTLPTEPAQVVDPLAEFIGAVAHGSLAASLDDELRRTLFPCKLLRLISRRSPFIRQIYTTDYVLYGLKLLP